MFSRIPFILGSGEIETTREVFPSCAQWHALRFPSRATGGIMSRTQRHPARRKTREERQGEQAMKGLFQRGYGPTKIFKKRYPLRRVSKEKRRPSGRRAAFIFLATYSYFWIIAIDKKAEMCYSDDVFNIFSPNFIGRTGPSSDMPQSGLVTIMHVCSQSEKSRT
ncbi:MAG: hypothetical protein UW10_C0028G0006 [Candidatus Magasanikbacteria bacterium GW2011_GWA2_43_9]|nr:MAG: hypothetical protein UW10_C0028G0006 [Candidatus Magasanikbacteria bacterium GW2011_GWA2_43_9]